jgi:hypothetical protein
MGDKIAFVSHKSFWALLVVGLALGCHRQESTPGSQAANPGDAPPPASPRGPGRANDSSVKPVVIAESGDVNATLQQLTQSLRDYVVRTRSVPKDFEEFAAKAQVQFPPAPDGKKYAIQDQKVVLLKR